MRKLLLTALIGLGLGVGAHAEIIVKLRPPIAVVEHRPYRPSYRHVWVSGYHRWDGHRYYWVRGYWAVPPHRHAVWVAPRWEYRHGGYVFVAGHWR